MPLSQCAPPYSKSLLPETLRRRLREEEETRRIYGLGDVSAGDSVVVAGLVVSVVGGLVAAGLAAGSVVSVFCSHAARSAALARMQMYFFIVLIGRPYCFNRLIGARQFFTAFDSSFNSKCLISAD
jgi:hypothetical protein